LDKAIDPKLNLDNLISNLAEKNDPNSQFLVERMRQMKGMADVERQEILVNLDAQIHSELLDAQIQILGKLTKEMVRQGNTFDEIYTKYTDFFSERSDLTNLLLGMFYAEIGQAKQINDKIRIGKKYTKFNPEFAKC